MPRPAGTVDSRPVGGGYTGTITGTLGDSGTQASSYSFATALSQLNGGVLTRSGTWDVAGRPDPNNGHCVVGCGYAASGVLIDAYYGAWPAIATGARLADGINPYFFNRDQFQERA